MNAEAAFRKNLRETVSGWRSRLGKTAEPAAIGAEAGELRGVAQAHGWSSLVTHLQGVEQVAREVPQVLAGVLNAFQAYLASESGSGRPAPNPPERTFVMAPRAVELPASLPGQLPPQLPVSVPMPPMLDATYHPQPPNAPNATPPVGPAVAPYASTLASERGQAPAPRPAAGAPPERRTGGSELPDSIAKPVPQPKLLVKTVFGFRAFGKKAGRASEPVEDQVLARDSPLLGLGKRVSKPPGRRSSAPPLAEGPPDFRGRRSSPAPFRPSPSEPWDGGRRQRPSGAPLGRAPQVAGQIGSHVPRHDVPRWAFILAGAIVFMAVSIVIVVLVIPRMPAIKPAALAIDAGQRAVATADDTSPTQNAQNVQKASDPMVDAVHEQGQETAELRALIDQQSRMIAACRLDASRCDKWAREALLLAPVDAGTFVPSSETGQPLSAWLQRLKMPRDFPAKDDPALAAFYGYDAKHPTGRADFQVKLFRCSKFDEILDTTLVKYGAPSWLKAVVYQESGCDPVITSPAGARGLWQFMPESARAYGLLVNEKADVDERLNPAKATDAAIHFLSDLHTKLGAWDLALAGYNMGPYGVALRITQVGGRAGFWDLRRSDLLPAETADYVPAIEAFALILENRRSLGFPIDVPLPESTSELNVKPGTRLSLVARAARTSTTRVKEHNLDFLGQTVPAGETTVRVPIPNEQVLQVQQALDNWPPDDTRDTCAPPDYVWGSGDFETTPYAKKCRAPEAP